MIGNPLRHLRNIISQPLCAQQCCCLLAVTIVGYVCLPIGNLIIDVIVACSCCTSAHVSYFSSTFYRLLASFSILNPYFLVTTEQQQHSELNITNSNELNLVMFDVCAEFNYETTTLVHLTPSEMKRCDKM